MTAFTTRFHEHFTRLPRVRVVVEGGVTFALLSPTAASEGALRSPSVLAPTVGAFLGALATWGCPVLITSFFFFSFFSL